MYLDLPPHVLRKIARFRLRLGVHTLRVEQAVWSNSTSPVCDICDSIDSKMKNMCCSDVPIPRSVLSVRSMPHFLSLTSLFYISTSPTGCPV
eukprot:315921-Pelagomonas_calceolata.AAC.1